MDEFLSFLGAAAVIAMMIFLVCTFPTAFAIFLVIGIVGVSAMYN